MIAWLLLFFIHFQPVETTTASDARLVVLVKQVKNSKGEIALSLFNQPQGFPEDESKRFRYKLQAASQGSVRLDLGTLPPGRYALAILHDENGNRKMDKNLLGVPREGYAFSNNPGKWSGAVDFQNAVFELKPGEQKQLEVNMIYW